MEIYLLSASSGLMSAIDDNKVMGAGSKKKPAPVNGHLQWRGNTKWSHDF
jgi:hypothetical protein